MSSLLTQVRKQLEKHGLSTYVIAEARSGSCYFGFDNSRMGKCRIGDHPERSRYGYKWQIREDISKEFITNTKGHDQFYFPANNVGRIVEAMVSYHKKITTCHRRIKPCQKS